MRITEQVTVNTSPAKNRKVIIVDANSKAKLAMTKTDDAGVFSVDVSDQVDSVIAIAFDDDGAAFKPTFIYERGMVVRPDPFVGFLLECDISGMTTTDLPAYPLNNGAVVQCGAAMFIVRQHFQPVAKFIPL